MSSSEDSRTSHEQSPAGAAPAKQIVAPVRRGGGYLGPLLGTLALLGVAGLGWQQWQARQLGADSAQSLASVSVRLDDLDERLQQLQAAQTALAPQLSTLAQQQQAVDGQWQGLDQRLRGLEAVVTRISERTLSAHDSLLLDEIESLLRTGQQRYQLFHDTAGALSAYELASATLERLDDPALSGVRQKLDQETAELRKAEPASGLTVQALQKLRQVAAEAPLRSSAVAVDDGDSSLWQRFRRVLQRLVSVRRDDQHGDPLNSADQRLARELAELDVIEAQAGLLASDQKTWRSALQQLESTLKQRFDTRDGEVAQTLGSLGQWLQEPLQAALPQLGGSLAELRDLRRINALQQKPPAPASAASAGASATAASTATASSVKSAADDTGAGR